MHPCLVDVGTRLVAMSQRPPTYCLRGGGVAIRSRGGGVAGPRRRPAARTAWTSSLARTSPRRSFPQNDGCLSLIFPRTETPPLHSTSSNQNTISCSKEGWDRFQTWYCSAGFSGSDGAAPVSPRRYSNKHAHHEVNLRRRWVQESLPDRLLEARRQHMHQA